MAELSAELVARIERELFVRTPLRPADLLFVFGTRHGVAEFLRVIEELWRAGLFTWALVTGGETAGDPSTEADILAEGMREMGIPDERIIKEQRAANTGENVTFSLPLIEARIGLSQVRSLIAVGKYYTSARYLMTLQRHWPAVEKMMVPVHYHPHPPDRWAEDPETRQKVVGEWRKLETYLAAGFIAKWPA
ncbi:MAG: YdcF family protein [Phenylobacterium sp.]|nr:YdcF family protein [Phenylobacterium sp.]